MEILKGLPVANAINEKLIEEQKNLKGAIAHLAIIRVGEKPDDCSYERGAKKKMEKLGFRCSSFVFDADIDNETFQKEFDAINNNDDIDGILLLRPLPKHLDEKSIENRIHPRKDLDGISPLNLAKVFAGDDTGYRKASDNVIDEKKCNGDSVSYKDQRLNRRMQKSGSACCSGRFCKDDKIRTCCKGCYCH